MGKGTRYPAEVRERAVRLVFEQTESHGSEWAAICSIADKMACSPEALRRWVRQTQRDHGERPGLTTSERERLKELEREVRDFADKQPAFAVGAGLLSLHWLVLGLGYEITGADVFDAYRATMAAAERHGSMHEIKERIRVMVAAEQVGGFVTKVLGRELGL